MCIYKPHITKSRNLLIYKRWLSEPTCKKYHFLFALIEKKKTSFVIAEHDSLTREVKPTAFTIIFQKLSSIKHRVFSVLNSLLLPKKGVRLYGV